MNKGLDVTGREKYTMALSQSFFSFSDKIPLKSHPEVGKSVAQLTLNVISNTTHSLLSTFVSIFTSNVVREAEQCDGHNTELV